MNPRLKRTLGLVARLAGMLALLALFVGSVDWEATGAELRQARLWPWFPLALLFYAVGQVLNGLGWRHLVRAAGIPVGLGAMVRHDLVSVFWSTVLPGSIAGEVVKGVRVAGSWERAESTAVGIVAARLVGGGMAASLSLLMMPLWSLGEGAAMVSRLALLTVVAVAVGGLFALRLGPAVLRRVLPSVAARVPSGRFPRPAELAFCMATSFAAHACFSAVYTCYFRAASGALGFADGSVIYTMTTVAQALPVTFGGFGVRELTMSGLGGTVIGPARAAAAAVIGTSAFSLTVLCGGVLEALRVMEKRSVTGS